MRGPGLIFDSNHKRALKPQDFERARIGELFHKVSIDQIPDQAPYKKPLLAYIENVEKHINNGTGLVLAGEHGGGKSASSIIVAMEVMSRGGSALFMEEAVLIKSVIQNEQYNEEKTIYERAQEVDLLIIDDLGLAPRSDNLHVIEPLIKFRVHRKRAVAVTTNLKLAEYSRLYPSVSSALQEAAFQIVCEGVDWRAQKKKELADDLEQEIKKA